MVLVVVVVVVVVCVWLNPNVRHVKFHRGGGGKYVDEGPRVSLTCNCCKAQRVLRQLHGAMVHEYKDAN